MALTLHHTVTLQSNCITLLEGDGYDLSVEASFEAVRGELRGIGKAVLTPNLDPRLNDFTTENAFCLVMRHGSELAGVVGVRFDAVGDEAVAGFWASNFARLYPTSDPRGAVRAQATELLSSIRGRLAYIGDLHIAPEHRGSTQRLMCFVHYAHALSYLKWRPDWIYAFQRREDVLKGYADKYGFNNRYPGAILWHDPPAYRSSSEYLATLSRAEFERLAWYYYHSPEHLVRG